MMIDKNLTFNGLLDDMVLYWWWGLMTQQKMNFVDIYYPTKAMGEINFIDIEYIYKNEVINEQLINKNSIIDELILMSKGIWIIDVNKFDVNKDLPMLDDNQREFKYILGLISKLEKLNNDE